MMLQRLPKARASQFQTLCRNFSQSHCLGQGQRRPSQAKVQQVDRANFQSLESEHFGYARNYKFNKFWIGQFIAANTLVFLAWQYALMSEKGQKPENRKWMRKTRQFMNDNFTLSTRGVREGRWWTLITSGFSHRELWHFAFNMIAFHQIGGLLAGVPGVKSRHIILLVFGSIFSGSVGFLSGERWDDQFGLGFSGAVTGIVTAAALLRPMTTIYLYGIVPMPLIALAGGYVAVDTYLLSDKTSTVGHDAHLGGAAFAGALYLLRLRKFGGLLGPRVPKI